MAYWFMRMRQGSDGEDFTSELWGQNLIGIMFGTWTIGLVLDGDEIDEQKLHTKTFEKYPPEGYSSFRKNWFHSIRRFLTEMTAGHKVVAEFDGSLHIATVTDEFLGDPKQPSQTNQAPRKYGEHFKCRRVSDSKTFRLEKLPSSYRLISSTGRGAVQRIRAYEPLVELLDRCNSPEEVTEYCRNMPTERLLEVISPKQWEAICAEYLRGTEGIRPLLLAVGSTLKDVDIYGVNRDGKRVLAQCKNDDRAWKAESVDEWVKGLANDSEDRLYFFARKGVKGSLRYGRCQVVDGMKVLKWLQSKEQEEYVDHLKTL